MSRKLKKAPAWLYVALAALLVVLVVALLLPSGRQQITVQNTAVIDPGADKESHRIADFAFEELNEQQGLQAPVETQPVHNGNPESGIALVMDDVGYDLHALNRVLALPFPVAISVLPDSPHASEAAESAFAKGHVVMLHLPMEPTSPKYRASMSSAFLREGMSESQVKQLFASDLQQVPHVTGVNNHMGSLLTVQPEPMRWVMDVCRERSLFFIDSKTAIHSVAADVAAAQGVRWGARRVFLDHTVEAEDMQMAWNTARRCAQEKQPCIVIAHPHAQTLDFLEHQVSESDRGMIKSVTTMLHTGKPS